MEQDWHISFLWQKAISRVVLFISIRMGICLPRKITAKTLSNWRQFGERWQMQLLDPEQEAFEKCWAHSPLRAASRPFTRCR